jgi:hypothetical protein
MGRRRASERIFALATLLAVPLALGMEVALRRFVLPPEFETLRAWLNEPATYLAWAVAALAAGGALAAERIFAVMARRQLARLGDPASVPNSRAAAAKLGAFILASSVVQLPALVATLTYTLGASPIPVAAAVACSTLGVARQAFELEKDPSRGKTR